MTFVENTLKMTISLVTKSLGVYVDENISLVNNINKVAEKRASGIVALKRA